MDFDQLQNKTAVVVGDLMLDRYVDGTVTRVNPEAPTLVLNAKEEIAFPGGAANVACRLRDFGMRVIETSGCG
jgi:D-beta-D-heptose 7-phosphate kinase/D-beta-D-heptose 1-phosphate adenosyltransferase